MRIILFEIAIWIMKKYYKYANIYAPGEDVSGITFSNSLKFIDYVSKFKEKK